MNHDTVDLHHDSYVNLVSFVEIHAHSVDRW